MATLLYRLGRVSFRRRGVVLMLWLVLLGGMGTAAVTISQPTSDSFALPGTEAQEAFDLLEDRVPQLSADGASANVVFAAPRGRQLTDPTNRAAIADSVDELAGLADVTQVRDPFDTRAISPDGRIGYAQVQYKLQPIELSEQARDALVAAGKSAEDAGLRVEIGGSALQPVPEPPTSEVVGIAVAAVVLAVTLGSLVAAGLPLLTALIGVGIGVGGVTASTAFFELSSTTSVLAMMLGLAVAIDYALLILTRYRHELSLSHDPEHAAGRAVGTAGNAVVFAGATVVIALAALTVVGIPMLTSMGLAAAGTVAIAVLIALTMLPALFGFAGRRILGKHGRDVEAGPSEPGSTGLGERWARFVTKRRVLVLLVAVPALAVLALPATDLRLGMPDDSTAAPGTTQRQAYELISEGFGPGLNGPLMVVADVAKVADPQGTARSLAGDIGKLDGVAQVVPPTVTPGGDIAVLNVIPSSGPGSDKTEQLVQDIRSSGASFTDRAGARLWVTGQTAMMIDVSDKLGEALIPYLIVVIGLALLLLGLVFRSVLVPLKATLGFLLTIGATFGAVVAVFQWGWLDWLFGVDQTAPIMSMLPIFMIGVVFGLAMDYQVFLVTRMREEYIHGAGPKDAVAGGFRHGARVVTAAALIMISVFAGFIASDDSMIKSVGLALAFGVLVDAFVVRMTIVPAVMSLLGRSAWWLPRWLDRLLPNVDVEGERLARSEPQVLEPPVDTEPGRAGRDQAEPGASVAATPHGSPPGEQAAGTPIEGHVSNTSGVPLDGAALTLIDWDGRQVTKELTASDGSYRLTVPQEGRFVLVASARAHRPEAVPVTVNSHPVRVELTLAGASTVLGKVQLAESGRVLPRATVTLTGSAGGVFASTTTDRNGSYRFSAPAAGNYTLVISSERAEPTAVPVTVVEGQDAQVDVATNAR